MCGIAGIVQPSPVEEKRLQAMTRCLAHRGPDGEGLEISGGVGFGHRRLSIIDLEGGAQPMRSDDGKLLIVFNGEIYNYRQLRAQLEDNYSFHTHSDTEVIMALYQQNGVRCLGQLRGMFAIAIYDFSQQQLFLARDHLGQKPLYYCLHNGTLAFASEIKALLVWKPALRQLDTTALHEYLTLRIITAPRSMFQEIRKLPPAHYALLQQGKLQVHNYWKVNYRDKLDLSYPEQLDALDQQVADSVNHHLVSDVPVGAFLSGGMDSSLIVAMMAKQQGGGFKTFSGEVAYKNYSELPYARIVSDRFETQAHEITIEPKLAELLPDLVWHMDEPSDPLSVCMYHIAHLAAGQVKVVLGGEGGDELFGGYDRYYGNRYASWYALMPEVLRRKLIGPLLRLLPAGRWYRGMIHQLQWMQQMSFFSDGLRYGKSLSYFYISDTFRKQLYSDDFLRQTAVFDPEAHIAEYFDAANADDILDRMLFADSMTRMPDHPVVILDRMSMAHGLEARAPLMDHKLAEFCAQLPTPSKVRGRQLRYIQTQLVARYLPKSLLERKKQGFSSPLTYLLADEFRHLYQVLLRDAHLVQQNILCQEGVQMLLDQHLAGRADHGQRLWQLCNAELWYRMYIEGLSKEDAGPLLARKPDQP